MIVRLRCTYPDQAPSEVEFTPGVGLGATREVVHARILELIRTREYVELPAVGMAPVPVWADTVTEIVVR